MKRINLVLISLLVAMSGFFVSCADDTDEDTNSFNEPTVEVKYTAAGGTSVTATANETIKKAEGTSIDFDVKFTMGDAGDKLTKITITSEISNKVYTIVDSTLNDGLFNAGDKTITYKYSTTVGSAVEKIVFSTLDKQNRKGEAVINVEPATVTPVGSVKTTEAIIMGSYKNTTYNSCYSLELNKTVSLNGGFSQQAMIDLLYFYGSSNEGTLAAPISPEAASVYNNATYGLAKWTTKRNDTKLLLTSITGANFDAITSGTAFVAAYPTDLATAKNLANHLTVGNVLAMKTEGGKTALIKVTEVNGTTSSGYIKITIKTVL